jgi:predicted metal-dependent phosphoesterase TrpH
MSVELRRLSPRQQLIAHALLVDDPVFDPPNPPVSYAVIGAAMGITVNTVKTHVARLRSRHPELYREVMAHRRAAFRAYHVAMTVERLERSRRWGRRRWAATYRDLHGEWPWDTYARDVTRAR